MWLLFINVPWIFALCPYECDDKEDGGHNEDHEDGDVVRHVELDHHVLEVDGVGGGEVASAEAGQVVALAGGVDIGTT